MVLLDVDDRECDAVGLEGWNGGRDPTEEGVGSKLQLHGQYAELQWIE